MLLKLSFASLLNRKVSVFLTLFSIAVSIAVLLGVEHIRSETKDNFAKTVSGVDLIVGGRTSQVNLLLYSIFRIGDASNNISWQSYQAIAEHPKVAWSVPISLGDSHRGYRVMGTTQAYFSRYQYGKKNSLEFSQGQAFAGVLETVLGAEVAKRLGYKIGDEIIISHGIGAVSFSKHDKHPFSVVGILAPTGTPVDQTVHVSLEGIEAIHIGWNNGVPLPQRVKAGTLDSSELTPTSITAFMLGMKSKVAIFSVQREINLYNKEPLLAILPGVALTELWQMMNVMENILRFISLMVLIAALLGMTAILFSSMNERQRELAILRALGVPAGYIVLLVELEALLITLAGMIAGALILSLGLYIMQDWIISEYGLHISANPLGETALYYLLAIIALAGLLAIVPAIATYKRSLASGLTIRT